MSPSGSEPIKCYFLRYEANKQNLVKESKHFSLMFPKGVETTEVP